MSNTCCVCKSPIRGLICNPCFEKWPKGMNFSEYANIAYTMKPKVIATGIKARDDFPRIIREGVIT